MQTADADYFQNLMAVPVQRYIYGTGKLFVEIRSLFFQRYSQIVEKMLDLAVLKNP